MSTLTVLALSIVLLTVLMIIGTPMPIAFGTGIVFIVFSLGINYNSLIHIGYSQISSYILLAMPLFVIGGALMSNSRIGIGIVNWFECILGRLRACLLPVTTAAFALFGAVSGSGMAVMSCLAPILFPRMKEKNYPVETVAAVLCCAAPLGLLIPPSCTQIVYAWSANVSVLSCFLAVATPGVAITVLMAVVSSRIAIKKVPDLPRGEKLPPKLYCKNLVSVTGKSAPGLVMPIIVLGGIYSGIMTTTESASVAAVYALLISILVYHEVKGKQFIGFMADAGVTTGVLMVNMFFVMMFSRLLLQEGLPKYILNLLLSVSDNKWVIMIMINIFMIILGMLMDDGCGTILCATILTPVIIDLGFSPYQFAAILGVNLGMGCITPPTAPFLYMSSRFTGVPVKAMIKDVMIILFLVYLPVLFITTFWPDFSLWLPKLVLGDRFSMF